jgi:hypothetical protein
MLAQARRRPFDLAWRNAEARGGDGLANLTKTFPCGAGDGSIDPYLLVVHQLHAGQQRGAWDIVLIQAGENPAGGATTRWFWE